MPPVRSSIVAYGLSLTVLAVAVVIRILLDPLLGDELALVTLFGATAFAVWLGGGGPAVMVACLGYLTCNYLFIPPRHQLTLLDAKNLTGLIAYLVTSGLIILIGEALRRTQVRSHKNAETLGTTLASIGDAVITTDSDGNVSFLNHVAEVLTGWRDADAHGKPLNDVFRIVNEASRAPAANPVDKVLASGRTVGLANHTLLIARDGTERPIDDSAAPIRGADGEIVGVVLVFRDIADRRGAERALEQSERELTDFFDNASVGIHWVGADGTILRANRTELAMLGYDHDEYVGRKIVDFHVDRPVIEEILSRLAQGETLHDFPARIYAKDRSIRDVLIDSNAMFANGRFVHSRCFTRDVTGLLRARKAERLLAAVVESSDDAIVSKSLDGTIMTWNKGAEQVFGYTAAEAVGQHITMLIPPDRMAEEADIMRRLRAGERIDHFESVRLRSDGRPIHVSLTISPIRDESGRVIGASKTARDVTETKLAEALVQESEQRLWATFNQAAVGIAVTSLDGTFVEVKQEVWRDLRLFGR